MRVVLDANVWISAAISSSPSHRVVHTWLADQPFQVILCPRLLDEVRNVLTERPRLRAWISQADAELFVATLTTLTELHPDPPPGVALTRDPDDYLIHLAHAHDADVIVSGDADLLEWDDQHPPVISPSAFDALLTRH
jgi:putative PIN family toxin of toxin-antitoxin system